MEQKRKIIPLKAFDFVGLGKKHLTDKYPEQLYAYSWNNLYERCITKSAIDLSEKVEAHCGIRLFPVIKTVATKGLMKQHDFKFMMVGENGNFYYFDFPRRYYNHNCYNLVEMNHPKGDKYITLVRKEPVAIGFKQFKKGDKVEIVSNIPYQLKHLPKPIIGTVVSVDGSYVMVRPKSQRYTVELLDTELREVVVPI